MWAVHSQGTTERDECKHLVTVRVPPMKRVEASEPDLADMAFCNLIG